MAKQRIIPPHVEDDSPSSPNAAPSFGWLLVVSLVLLSGGFSLLFLNSTSYAIGERYPDQGVGLHLASLLEEHPPYNSNPPTSGWHVANDIAPWGIHTEPLPDEVTVHNLEHSGIIIHYRQSLSTVEVEQLKKIVQEIMRHYPCILLAPRREDQLEVPVALTAWTYLLRLPSVEGEQIRQFVSAHANKGPEMSCQA